MSILDILLAIPLCFFIYKGWRRGIIFELAALCGVIIGCYAAIHFSKWVAEMINIEGDGAILIAFFITFLGVVIGTFFLGKAAEGFVKLVKVNSLNKILGAALGLAKCLCVLSVLISFVIIVDHEQEILTPDIKKSSTLFKPTYKIGNKLTSTLQTYVHNARRAKENSNSD